MDQGIRDAVEIINQRIKRLEQIKAMLLDEFGADAALAPQAAILAASAGRNGDAGTRKQQLINYLRQHGPARRIQIITQTRIPPGTVAYLLNGDEFVRKADGTWDLANQDSAQETAS